MGRTNHSNLGEMYYYRDKCEVINNNHNKNNPPNSNNNNNNKNNNNLNNNSKKISMQKLKLDLEGVKAS